ncbi:MAG: SLAP domain-containing protein [Gilliamella sp.]|uniref:SLAP domain-containing protein n=1 Tax=Gilliamella sp. TaxID=1891236 RepID=UPI0025E80285|nr:SLAP domain-containing protein [Gilliamella sp.]MCO6538450.1 SLAP domain-containing protein [Gilliamella sp.]
MKLTKKIATALCAVALTGVGTVITTNANTQTVFANHQGTKVWLQYGTLKYDLRAPSGRVYPAGTRVVRKVSDDAKPSLSAPNFPFYLTLQIGGLPGNQLLQDVGGGYIAEAYVDYDDWNEIDYPSENTVIVQNTENNADLSSSDFHPVNSSNPDVASVNRDQFNSVFADFMTSINFNNINDKDRNVVAYINQRQRKVISMNTNQTEVDQLTEYVQNVIDMYKKTGHLTGVYDPAKGSTNGTEDNSGISKPSDNATGNNGSGSVADNPTSTNVTSPRTVKLRKASYRYTSKGKRVSKKLLKKGSYVKINGKTYYIKGKTYYRIAKNRYIRKANVAK